MGLTLGMHKSMLTSNSQHNTLTHGLVKISMKNTNPQILYIDKSIFKELIIIKQCK